NPHTIPTEHEPLPLHDALPIWARIMPNGSVAEKPLRPGGNAHKATTTPQWREPMPDLPSRQSLEALRQWDTPTICNALEITSPEDRKSTRLNSSHQIISYAVFC